MAELPDVPADPVLARKLERVGSPRGVAIALGDSAGCIEWVNQAFQQLTGYAAAELMGKRLDLFRGLDIGEPALDYVMARFRRGEPSRLEIRTRGSQRHRPRWLAVEVQPLGADEGFAALVRDLSGQPREQGPAERSEESAPRVERRPPAGQTNGPPLSLRPVDLSQMVMQSCELLEAAVSGRTLLDLDLAGNLPPVLADSVRLREVAVSLVRRAADALDGTQGAICVRTRLVHEPEVGCPRVGLEVRSTGWGAEPPGTSAALVRSRATRPSLSAGEIRNVVEAHGGSISLAENPREGTLVLLPCSEP